MKRYLCLFISALLLSAGCKEKLQPIMFTNGVLTTDSTYVTTSIPAPDPHNVLVEEFTGQKCAPCINAQKLLESLRQLPENRDRINVVGIYVTGPSQSVPPDGAAFDFRTANGTLVNTSIYNGKNDLPSGGVDRVPVGGSISLYKDSWADAINDQKAVINPLNLKVESEYLNGKATIKATITYVSASVEMQNLSIVIVEDSIIDFHECFITAAYPNGVDSLYLYTDVLRSFVTAPPVGDPILPGMAQKEAGRVYWKKYTYTPDLAKVNPAHCRVIAFVNSPGGTGGDYHVIQSQQVKMVH